MRCILITRPIAEAEATRRKLEAMGRAALVEPMLTVSYRDEPLPSGRFDAVIATSGNALAAIARRPETAVLLHLPLVAVGRRTAAAARALGFAEAESPGRDVEALIAHIAAHWRRPHRVLYLAGADRTADLAAALGPLGHDVTVATVYDAVKTVRFSDAARKALQEGSIDAVLHYSARTAEAFIACCGADMPLATAPFRHVCLSHKVGEVLRSAGGRRILVAERPDEDAMLALLA